MTNDLPTRQPVPIAKLPLGAAFRVDNCALAGRLVHLSNGAATIELAPTWRSFAAHRAVDGSPVEVTIASTRRVTIALGTMVHEVEP